MTITSKEYVGILPITAIAFMYWLRNIYLYNRKGDSFFSFTRVQLQVLTLNLVWVAFTWFGYLAISRGQLAVTIISSVARSILGWYNTVAIINENFVPTRQQMKAFLTIVIIALTWDATSLLIFSNDD